MRVQVRNGKHFKGIRMWCVGVRSVQQEMPFVPGGVVQFPAEICQACPLRERCTTSRNGRSVSIHPDEALLCELRERQLTEVGRTKLRERVAVEHALAHIGHWQGRRARYRGLRKNLFDLRRCAVVHNLYHFAIYHQRKSDTYKLRNEHA